MLEIPQLQVSFGNRDALAKKDYETIKKLGLKFQGQRAWPMFRSYRPGFFPWFMEAKEASFMRYVLEQTLDVTLRCREDESLLDTPDNESYLVRVPHKKDNSTFVWEDRTMRVPPPESLPISIALDPQKIKAGKRLPQSQHTFEIDFFILPATVGEKGDRPCYPYILLVVDAQSGMILGTESLTADPSLEAMHGSIPMKVVDQLSKASIVPKEIRVRSELLFQLLQPLAEQLPFKLTQSPTFQSLDFVKESLLQHF